MSHYFQPEYLTDFVYPSLYAISFSADSNNLAMWNMYGDDRRGVNIHILNSSVEFHSNFEEPIVGADFLDVKYGSISENPIIGNIIMKDYLQYLKDKRDGKSFIFGNAFELNKIMLNGIAKLKHRTYKYENETRIIVISNSPTNEREVDGKIIPYVELKIPLSWVEGVTFGSLVDDTQISFYKKKLEEKGLGNINIDKAVIPFRE